MGVVAGEFSHSSGPNRSSEVGVTAASLAISCGANIKAIQRMLGHKNASMTLDVYGDLYTEDLEDLADRLDKRLRGVA
jgi:integrase